MENKQEQLDALRDIRQMMKQSNRFLSLSGLSGIFAGFYALVGAYVGSDIISNYLESHLNENYSGTKVTDWLLVKQVAIISFAVLAASILTAWFFSARKAKKHGSKLFDHTAWRLFLNMAIPLGAGGLFCLSLLINGFEMLGLLSPVMLIFYGLALVNASKYTLHEIRYLGCCEIVLGLIAAFKFEYGLLLWSVGFGVLHIVYGAYMWFTYDRK